MISKIHSLKEIAGPLAERKQAVTKSRHRVEECAERRRVLSSPNAYVQHIEHMFNSRFPFYRSRPAAASSCSVFRTLILYLGDNYLLWEAAMPATETSPATAVERALNILEAAAQRREGLTNAEISRKLAIPKSSASYILRTLEKRSYLRREAETGRYRLGCIVFSLGGKARTNLGNGHVGLPFMRSVRGEVPMQTD